MIKRTSTSAAALALTLSLALHLGGAFAYGRAPEEAQIEGGAPTSVTRLGNSFRDVAQGSATPAPETTTEPLEPHKLDEVKATPSEKAERAEAKPAETPAPQPLSPIGPAVLKSTPTPLAEPLKARALTTPAAAQKPLEPLPEPVKLTALPDPKPVVKTQQPASAAGADKAEQRGTNSGQSSADANQGAKRQAAKAAAAGNAALTNYQGKVWRRIERERPSGNHRGAVLLSLTISGNGRLAGLKIARSSGSQQLDQLALRAARKAAPYPPPPDGKTHRFTFKLRGR